MSNAPASASTGPTVDPSFAGRTYPPGKPYEVSAEKIAEFAAATGAASPLHTDRDAARAAGYENVVAPPTFLVSLAQRAEAEYIEDPAAGIDFSRVVHGEEKFELERAVVAGDVLIPTLTVQSVRAAGANAMVSTRVDISDENGEQVARVHSMLVIRAQEAS